MEEVFNDETGSNSTLSCRAKEVQLTSVKTNLTTTCKIGTKITVDLYATIEMVAARYDLGWYIATDGGDALTGTCAVNSLDSSNKYNITGGNVTWTQDANGRTDVCGDLFTPLATPSPVKMDSVALGKQLELECEDVNADGYLDFSICFSWRTGATDSVCDPSGVYPGSPSACDCATYQIPTVTTISNTTHSTCV